MVGDFQLNTASRQNLTLLLKKTSSAKWLRVPAFFVKFVFEHPNQVMSPHSDQQYIEAIRQHDKVVIRQLIDECYPPVERWICQNSGNPADAEDVFADALEAVFRKLKQGHTLNLTARFSTFIFSICKNHWLKRLRQKKGEDRVRTDNAAELTTDTESWEQALEDAERMQFVQKKWEQLSESCRQLLELCWSDEKKTMTEIARILKFASAGYASKRKHQCIEKLKALIKEDPDFGAYF